MRTGRNTLAKRQVGERHGERRQERRFESGESRVRRGIASFAAPDRSAAFFAVQTGRL